MAVVKIQPARMITGGAIPTLDIRETASSSWERGALLIKSSGKAATGATEPVNEILGIAYAAATGTTDTTTLYCPALPNVVFRGSIGTSTSAGAPAASDLYQLYPLALSSGDWFVDKTDNTNPCVLVIGIDDDQIGVTNGLVDFIFIQDATIFSN